MKRMANSISLHGNPIFDTLSRKHYPQILQIGNENGDLPIVEMLDPSAYEEGGQYFSTDMTDADSQPVDTRNRRDPRAEEATETEIILESLLSLGASNALEIESMRHQINLFQGPSSSAASVADSSVVTRSDGTFTPEQFDTAFASPFQVGMADFPSHDPFQETFTHDNGEMYHHVPAVVHRSLPSIAPPGISTQNERKFLHHYLHFISARLTSPDRGKNNPFRNAFARLATDFPPLLHGILAISAADLARYDRTTSIYEAVLHYQGCIRMLATALNEPTAIIADEALATTCLLFLHDVSPSNHLV